MMHFWKKSIAGQLSFAITLTMLIAFLVVGIFVYSYMSGQTMEHVQRENSLKAESISKDISYNFEKTKVIVQQMATNQQIIRFLKTTSTREAAVLNSDYADVLKALAGVHAGNELFNIAWVASEKASFYIDNSGYISDAEYAISQRPWFPMAKNSKNVVFSTPYVDYGTKQTIISCILGIREEGELIGFVAVDLVIGNIPGFFEKYRIGTQGINFLIDGDGTYIYHDDESKIMQESILQSSGGLQSVGSRILAHRESSGFGEITFEGERYFIAYHSTQDKEWVVGSLINKREALRELKGMAALIAALCGLAVVVLVAFVHFLFRQMTKPIRGITQYAREIAEGDFSKNLPVEYLERSDEMGKLSHSFQAITDAFRNENVVLAQKIHEAEKQLESQYRYIIETEKMASLGTLVAGVAHEINTPLGVGLSMASYLEEINLQNRQLLQSGQMSKADLQSFMEDLDASLHLMGDNLTRAAEMVKSFKQVAVDQISEALTEFSLGETLNAVVLSLRHEYKHMDCKYHIDCSPELRLESYPGVFIQVFSNLITNSIHHGFKERQQGNIYIEITSSENVLKIKYRDDGVGIPAENLKRIYDPFFTTARQSGSSGLGLNIVYNLVCQKLRGSIACHSIIGEGTTFLIEVGL